MNTAQKIGQGFRSFGRRSFLLTATLWGTASLVPVRGQAQGDESEYEESAADALINYTKQLDKVREYLLNQKVTNVQIGKVTVSDEFGDLIDQANRLNEKYRSRPMGGDAAQAQDFYMFITRVRQSQAIKTFLDTEVRRRIREIPELESSIQSVQNNILNASQILAASEMKGVNEAQRTSLQVQAIKLIVEAQDGLRKLSEDNSLSNPKGRLINTLEAVKQSLSSSQPRIGRGNYITMPASYIASGKPANAVQARKQIKEIIRRYVRPGVFVQVIIGYAAVWRILAGISINEKEARMKLIVDALSVIPRSGNSNLQQAATELSQINI